MAYFEDLNLTANAEIVSMGKPRTRFYNLLQLVTSLKSIPASIVLSSSYTLRLDLSAARTQNRPFAKEEQ